MDSLNTDVLHEILDRLDKIDSRQSQFYDQTGLLQTVHNIQELQTRKQNEKLSEMASQLEQEKMFMRDQLKGAQDEILERLRDIQKHVGAGFHRMSQDTSDPTRHMLAPPPLQHWNEQVFAKLNILDDRTLDTAKQCLELTKRLHNIESCIENKMTKLAEHNMKNITSSLQEIKFIPDTVRGQTKAELVWLNSEIDQRLSDVDSVNKEILKQQREVYLHVQRTSHNVDKLLQHHATMDFSLSKQMEEIIPAINKQHEQITQALNERLTILTDKGIEQIQARLELQGKIEQVHESVSELSKETQTSAAKQEREIQLIRDAPNQLSGLVADISNEFQSTNVFFKQPTPDIQAIKRDLETYTEALKAEFETQTSRKIELTAAVEKELRNRNKLEADNSIQYNLKLEDVKKLVNSLTEKTISLQSNLATVATYVALESVKTSTDTILRQFTNEFKNYIYNTKREIFAVIEKEAQIVRDRIEGPLPSHGKYTFDFYVEHFKTLVRSGKVRHSTPWHINEMKSCVTGYVIMCPNGDMQVWLLHGRHPREVGLQPRSIKSFKVKVTICNIYKLTLPHQLIGETTLKNMNEATIPWNGCHGHKLGVTSCDQLLQKGYGDKEGYDRDALLIRYDVTIS